MAHDAEPGGRLAVGEEEGAVDTVREIFGAALEEFAAVVAERLPWAIFFGILAGGTGLYVGRTVLDLGVLSTLVSGLLFAIFGFLGALLPEVFDRDQ